MYRHRRAHKKEGVSKVGTPFFVIWGYIEAGTSDVGSMVWEQFVRFYKKEVIVEVIRETFSLFSGYFLSQIMGQCK